MQILLDFCGFPCHAGDSWSVRPTSLAPSYGAAPGRLDPSRAYALPARLSAADLTAAAGRAHPLSPRVPEGFALAAAIARIVLWHSGSSRSRPPGFRASCPAGDPAASSADRLRAGSLAKRELVPPVVL